ncbi:MAG: GTP-binding protein [Pirellulaceae bacterium]|nr:GTP-binding protein [Pirellulaceae bacterium]
MKKLRPKFRFLTWITFSFLGALLLYFTFQVVEHYQAVRQWGQPWITLYFLAVTVGALLFFGTLAVVIGRLILQSRFKAWLKRQRNMTPSQLSPADQKKEIDANLSEVKSLQTKTNDSNLMVELAPIVTEFVEKQRIGTLEIAAFGTISSGKSSLLNAIAGQDVFASDVRGGTTVGRNEIPWSGTDKVTLVDTPGLSEIDGESRQQVAASAAKNADLVLLVVDGPLRQSEFQLVQLLYQMEKKMLVCLNKTDLYNDEERHQLLEQIEEQVTGLVATDDVVAVRSNPRNIIRQRILSDGSELEESVELSADIQPLARRMLRIIEGEGQPLLLANLLLRSRGLVEEARRRVRESLDRQAWRIVDRHMWSAAGAAAISPFPVVDLMVGCAVSTKMVLDVAGVYRQKMDQESAAKMLAELGKHLVGLFGGVTATAAVGSLLKGVPGAGWVAGGILQGVAQALVIRWIGSVFIEYFGEAMNEPEGGLAGLAQRKWDQITSVSQLRQLVNLAKTKWG